jgi:hypothetical protein
VSIRDYPGLKTGCSAALPGDLKIQDKAGLRARGRVRKRSGEMNNTEASFAEKLKQDEAAGTIQWWAFEAMKFRLADNTFYTPDFAVLYRDGSLWLIDTKGTTKKDGAYKPFVEEDAKIKAKLAAEIFPIAFALAYRLPKKEGGNWVIEEV